MFNKIFERLLLHSAKLTHVVPIALKQLSSKYLAKIIGLKLCKYIKFAIPDDIFMEIHFLESPLFFRFLLNRNVDQFI